MDIINQDRDLYGMCSLDKYEDYLNEELIDSSFMNDIVEKFEKINDLYQEYEDIAVYMISSCQLLEIQRKVTA